MILCFLSFLPHRPLNWLTKRAELQPRGCGLLSTKDDRSSKNMVPEKVSGAGVDHAVRSTDSN